MMLREKKTSTDCYEHNDQTLLPVYMEKEIWSFWCLGLRLEQGKAFTCPSLNRIVCYSQDSVMLGRTLPKTY
jgi:hypothetical protein